MGERQAGERCAAHGCRRVAQVEVYGWEDRPMCEDHAKLIIRGRWRRIGEERWRSFEDDTPGASAQVDGAACR